VAIQVQLCLTHQQRTIQEVAVTQLLHSIFINSIILLVLVLSTG
jgi:hypothetical protein